MDRSSASRDCRWHRLWIVAVFAALQLCTAPVVHAAEPLPACRYDHVPTRYTAEGAWRKTLVDTILRLPRAYAPSDLRSTERAGLNGGYRVRAVVIDDLRAMARAARRAGAPLRVLSAYRSFDRQKQVFAYWVDQLGYRQALRESARAGHSEHQLGTTLDFGGVGDRKAPWDHRDWSRTKAGQWLTQHAWRFGFVMSYPRDSESETCYIFEPWHYRYLGRRRAAAFHDSGDTLRRYLWEHHETAR
jgi:D-alanyl-D-alanine carboxypeptidase